MSKSYPEDQLIKPPGMDNSQTLDWEVDHVLVDQIQTNLIELGL